MRLYAVEDATDALAAARAFLLPFDGRRWAKLAVLVFFVASGAGPSAPSRLQFTGWPADPPGLPRGLLDALANDPWLVFSLAALALLVGLAFALVASLFEFVFVQALRTDEVAIRRNVRRYWSRGLRLFAFRVVVGLFALGAFVVLGLFVLVPIAMDLAPLAALALVVAVPMAVLLGIGIAVLDGFTTAFVVPVMMLEDRGVLDGWRRFWPTLAGQWKQYLAYAVAVFFLGIALTLLAGIVVAVPLVLLFVPFAIVAWAVLALLAESLLQIALFLGLVVTYLLIAAAVIALVQVPVQSYLRYYALLVLGDTNPDLDVIPVRRAAIRDR